MLGIVLVVMILPTICWIWLLIDCIKRDKFRYGNKVMWIILLLFTNMLGMVVYYVLEKKSGGYRGDVAG